MKVQGSSAVVWSSNSMSDIGCVARACTALLLAPEPRLRPHRARARRTALRQPLAARRRHQPGHPIQDLQGIPQLSKKYWGLMKRIIHAQGIFPEGFKRI
eukprot:gene13435-biopygen8023